MLLRAEPRLALPHSFLSSWSLHLLLTCSYRRLYSATRFGLHHHQCSLIPPLCSLLFLLFSGLSTRHSWHCPPLSAHPWLSSRRDSNRHSIDAVRHGSGSIPLLCCWLVFRLSFHFQLCITYGLNSLPRAVCIHYIAAPTFDIYLDSLPRFSTDFAIVFSCTWFGLLGYSALHSSVAPLATRLTYHRVKHSPCV